MLHYTGRLLNVKPTCRDFKPEKFVRLEDNFDRKYFVEQNFYNKFQQFPCIIDWCSALQSETATEYKRGRIQTSKKIGENIS